MTSKIEETKLTKEEVIWLKCFIESTTKAYNESKQQLQGGKANEHKNNKTNNKR